MKPILYFKLLISTAIISAPFASLAMTDNQVDQNTTTVNGNATTDVNGMTNQNTTNMNGNVTTDVNGNNNTMVNHTGVHVKSTKDIPTPAEDRIITESVKKWIDKSRVLSKLDVGVKTNQGIVTLSGTVNSDSEASALVELAMSIIGVRDVNTSELKVRASQQPVLDTWITAKAKGALIREEIFGNRDVAPTRVIVETKNGVVYLTGTVNNQQQITNAIEIVKKIDGVKQVIYKFSKVLPHTDPVLDDQHNDSTQNGTMQNHMDQNHTDTTNGNGTMNGTQNGNGQSNSY